MIGEVTEWLKVHAWNACVRKYREFESHPLRHPRLQFDSRALRNEESRTPPGPGGSNGSDTLRVLQVTRLSFFLYTPPRVLPFFQATVLHVLSRPRQKITPPDLR